VPATIYEIKESDLPRAREIQKRVSGAFEEHFSKGLAVTGFERTPESGTYLLSEWAK